MLLYIIGGLEMNTFERHLYFGYGMNTNLSGMATRCPTANCLGAAVLPGYRFVFRGHADVELDADCYVDGVLWQISDLDLKSLDRLEGFPSYYLRQRAWVETADGDQVIAWVYSMGDQSYEWEPGEHYLQCCLEGYRENGVPTTQIKDALEYVKAAPKYEQLVETQDYAYDRARW